MVDSTNDPKEMESNSICTNKNLDESVEIDTAGMYIKYMTRFQHNGVKPERNGYIVFRSIHAYI